MVRGRKSGIFLALAILFLISLTAVPAVHAQAIHEDPDNLAPVASYKDEVKMQLHLQDMMYQSYGIPYFVNRSDYVRAKMFLDNYDTSYTNYQLIIQYSDTSDSIYNILEQQMSVVRNDLAAWIYDSKGYNEEYGNYSRFVSSGDTTDAIISAIKLRGYYTGLADADSSITSNADSVTRLLNDTAVSTDLLTATCHMMDWQLKQLSEKQDGVEELLNRTTLSLAADQDVTAVGDTVTFTGTLKTDSTVPLANESVLLIVNGQYAETGMLDTGGLCTISYRVPEDTRNPLQAYLSFRPDRPGLVPVNSSPIEMSVEEMGTKLSASVTPADAAYGRNVTISGALYTTNGTAVPGKTVYIYLNSRNIGTAITAADGTYYYVMPVTYDTPGGECGVFTRYVCNTSAGDIYLTSESEGIPLYVETSGTRLTFNLSNLSLIGGDVISPYGTFVTDDGTPVSGAPIVILDGKTPIGYCTTGADGAYAVNVTIPYNVDPGEHVLEAAYLLESRSLNVTGSPVVRVTYGELNPGLTCNNMPQMLFADDVLYVHGSLLTGNGMPMGGQCVVINISGVDTYTVTTDAEGNYMFFYKVSYSDLYGSHTVTVTASNCTASAGETLFLPYNKLASMILAIVAISLVLYVFLRVTGIGRIMSGRNSPRRQAAASRAGHPADSLADGAGSSQAGDEKPAYDIEAEIGLAGKLIEEGNFRKALVQIYIVLKHMAIVNGIDIGSSVTHRELYSIITSRRASLSSPLKTIIRKYELVNFGHRAVSKDDLSDSVNSLSQVYGDIESKDGGGRSK